MFFFFCWCFWRLLIPSLRNVCLQHKYRAATDKRCTDAAVSDRLFETGRPMEQLKQELYTY